MLRFLVFLALLQPLCSFSTCGMRLAASPRAALLMRVGPDGTGRRDKFSYERGRVTFGSKLLIDRVVPRIDTRLAADYLSDPMRVLKVVWDHDKIEVVDLAKGDFLLTLRPLRFVTLRFQPCVRMNIRFDDSTRTLSMQSQGFSLRGLEGLDSAIETVQIDVTGSLAVKGASESGETLRLVGNVAFETSGKIPFVLRLTPARVIQAAGTAINAQILEYVKEKFLGPLISAMRQWKDVSDAVEGGSFQRTT